MAPAGLCPILAASERCVSVMRAFRCVPIPSREVCPIGMVFNDGACRKLNPRPDPKPPIVVNNNPCAKLGGAEFRAASAAARRQSRVDPKLPIKGPVTGGGDVKPIGNPRHLVRQATSAERSVSVNPVKPNVILRPQFDGPKTIRDRRTVEQAADDIDDDVAETELRATAEEYVHPLSTLRK